MSDDSRSDDRTGRGDLDEALRELAAEERRGLGEHPDPVTLLDYHEGKLSAAAADRVQEHLALCPECSEAILDFASFPHLEPRTEAHRLTPADVERQRRELQARLEREARPLWQRHQVLLPLAAAFFLAALGLGAWGARLQERVTELQGPRGDTHAVGTLRPETMALRGTEAHRFPTWARRVTVYLPLAPAETEYRTYEVDVVSAAGRRVLSGLRVERGPDGGFTVDLPRDLFSAGEYRFDLFGIEEGGRRELARYRLAVERQEAR